MLRTFAAAISRPIASVAPVAPLLWASQWRDYDELNTTPPTPFEQQAPSKTKKTKENPRAMAAIVRSDFPWIANPHPTSSFWISPQGNFPRSLSWILLGLVDSSRTPSGTLGGRPSWLGNG